MLSLVGIPMFFLESSFGQFASLGPVAVWKSVPMLQGVGVTMVLLITIANISYACIIGYSLYYLFASFQSPLPKAVLHRTSSLDETGEIVWHLALCLLLAWLMVGAAFLKGIKSSGKAGIYWLHLMDYFCTGWILITVALLELIGLSWIYGINRFIKDIEMMIGERNWLFWLWWRTCWILISPCILTAILVWSLTTFAPPTYGPVEYPVWSIALGWCMIIFCIMWVPIMAVVRVVQAEGATLWQKISAACTSAPEWGPHLEQHRGERYRKKPDSTEALNQVQRLVTAEI
ncbi:hypothetical protein chiPu_0018168 [Chiloscyllium punctatum]|uniref:Transporter n=1 Tax=Chiloscyllium punctatum TaxID=137246 RepID=A0A401RLP0_CHIPU|nr:hypothetical protein [Chiloscyllium punctatum]